MVKEIEKLLKRRGRKSFDIRTSRKIKLLNKKSDILIKTICEWYKIDDNEKISVISQNAMHEDDSNSKIMELHIRYQHDITTQLEEILHERDQTITKIKKNRNSSAVRRDQAQMIEHLKNLENLISNDVNRILHNKRRKEMEKVCRLERVENKVKVHNFTTRQISKDLLLLLNKGPNTVPKNTIPIYERKEKCKSYLADVLKQTVNCKSKHRHL